MVAECNSTVLLREDEDEQVDGENARIESIYDVLDMTDEQRNHTLRSLSPKQQSKVAEFCNACVLWCTRVFPSPHHALLQSAPLFSLSLSLSLSLSPTPI